MTTPVEFDIFISYTAADDALVLPLVRRLKDDGFTVWFDKDRMIPGLPVLDQLGDAIANSAHTIACLSDAYLAREYTTFELQSSMNRDPASKLARTIPARLGALTRSLPNFIQHLTMCDLTDPVTFEQTYAQVKHSIRTVPRPRPGLDEQAVALACDAPLQHLTEPDVALFLIRRAADALTQYLFRREVGEPDHGTGLEALQQALIVSGKIPTEIAQSLTYLRTFGNFVVHDQGDQSDQVKVTGESIGPALTTLRDLAGWVFPDRPQGHGRLPQILAALPRIGEPDEVQIPGTSFRFREPPLGRTALGPVFAGRDTANGDPVTVTLVDLPDEREAAFLEQADRCAGLGGTGLVSPISAGRATAAGGDHCLYVIHPATGDISAHDLAARHGGRLPLAAAYEIGAGVAHALGRLHAADPPLARGPVTPGEVLISRFGSVRLICPGREAGTPEADLEAVPTLLRTLAGGADDLAVPQARTATQLGRLLDGERQRRPAADGLRARLRGLAPAAPESSPGLELIETYPVKGRRCWPLVDGRVLVWETESERLVVLDGPRPHWRDQEAVPVRIAVTGHDGQVAIGGWDGAIRYFAGGELVTAATLDGTVGDLRFTPGGLVAGSWRGELSHFTRGGERHPLLGVPSGVHRIAVAGASDRFAVADQSGRLAIYQDSARTVDWQPFGTVADLAYAGSRLVVLTDRGLTGMHLDHPADGLEPKPGALRLLPGAVAGTCLLLVAADPRNPATSALEAWSIDQDDRHIRHTTFPPGYRIRSSGDVRGRFTLALPGGGCAYWRDDAERRVWPDALDAALTTDGSQIAVCRPGRVELYAEHG